MIKLRGSGLRFANVAAGPIKPIRITTDIKRPKALRKSEAFLITGDDVPEGFGWYLKVGGPAGTFSLSNDAPTALLPIDYSYLADGDVIRLLPEQNGIRVLHRRATPSNSFLLTERCNNYCLMCSQPPRDVDDNWIFDEVLSALRLIDRDAVEIMLTGGEPTLLEGRFLELVQACKSYLPNTAVHVLSNGRTFADESFAAKLAEIGHPDLMVGVPLYADVSHIHNYVVQAEDAFDETIRGILNLKKHGQKVEIRVVLHKQTIPRLTALATFITRNLLFVDQVVLMGLEITGFTRANMDALWIDPADYQAELTQAVGILDRARIKTSIYNAQLCLMDQSIWKFAKRSISDWKQEYMPECASCELMPNCAGFFASASIRYSDHIKPLLRAA
jgi:His-Xaa-Ser system radical SAM maturase HxsC